MSQVNAEAMRKSVIHEQSVELKEATHIRRLVANLLNIATCILDGAI